MQKNLLVKEVWVNRTENYIAGDSGIYESRFETPGEAFKGFRKLYGRPVSKQFVEYGNGESKQIGWVFQKKAKYEDTGETYIAETWVSLHSAPDEIKTKSHYYNFK